MVSMKSIPQEVEQKNQGRFLIHMNERRKNRPSF